MFNKLRITSLVLVVVALLLIVLMPVVKAQTVDGIVPQDSVISGQATIDAINTNVIDGRKYSVTLYANEDKNIMLIGLTQAQAKAFAQLVGEKVQYSVVIAEFSPDNTTVYANEFYVTSGLHFVHN